MLVAAHERGCESAVLIRSVRVRRRAPLIPTSSSYHVGRHGEELPRLRPTRRETRWSGQPEPHDRQVGVLLDGPLTRWTFIWINDARAADLPSIFTPATRHVSNHRREKDEGGLRRGAAWTFGLVDQRRSMKTHHRRGD